MAAVAATPPRLLLTPSSEAVPAGWTAAPAIETMIWQPNRLLRTGSRTIDSAAETLAAALLASPDAPDWLRLEAFDLTAVGDCETCQPPPLDPHRYRPLETPVTLDPRQYRFFAAVAERLRGDRFQPVVLVPAGGEPSPVELPENVIVLLAGPAGPDGFGAAAMAARQAQWERWHQAGCEPYSLIADGLGEFYGLPLNGDLLRQQAAKLLHPAALTRSVATFEATGPDWLTARLRAVVAQGQTTPAGDRWRADQPLLARAVDVFAPVADQLGDVPDQRLAAAMLQALDRLAVWDAARAAGQPQDHDTVAALTAYAMLRGSWEPAGPLSAGFAQYIASAEPLPNVVLSPTTGVTIDGFLADDEWRGATRVELVRDPTGQPTERPATVWLAADAQALSVAVVSTEPSPADSTLADRLVVRLSDGRTGIVRIELPVGQQPTAAHWLRNTLPVEGLPVRGLAKEAVFDGPGWIMEARLPWSQIGLESGALRAMGLATEHRSGSLRTITQWCPDGGGEHLIERLARVRVR